MPLHIARHHLPELLHEHRTFRTRSHETHVTQKDVDEIGQFVQRIFAQERANPRAPRVARFCPDRPRFRLRILHHRTEFETGKRHGIQAHALLAIDRRTSRIQFNEKRKQEQQRRDEDEHDRTDEEVNNALERQAPPAQRYIAHGQERQTVQVADVDFGGHDLKHIRENLDADLAVLAVRNDREQVLMRSFRQRDNHFVYAIIVNGISEVEDFAEHRQTLHDVAGAVIVQKANGPIAQLRRAADLVQDEVACFAGADDEHFGFAPAATIQRRSKLVMCHPRHRN